MYNIQLTGPLFSPSLKNKKNPPQENFLYSNIKNFLYFLKRYLFLLFRKWEPEDIVYISGNGTFLYFRERNILIFRKGVLRSLAYLELEAHSEPWHILSLGIFRASAMDKIFDTALAFIWSILLRENFNFYFLAVFC